MTLLPMFPDQNCFYMQWSKCRLLSVEMCLKAFTGDLRIVVGNLVIGNLFRFCFLNTKKNSSR